MKCIAMKLWPCTILTIRKGCCLTKFKYGNHIEPRASSYSQYTLYRCSGPTRKGSFLIHILPKNELTYNPMEWKVVKTFSQQVESNPQSFGPEKTEPTNKPLPRPNGAAGQSWLPSFSAAEPTQSAITPM